jgi:Helix-turn-helix domain
MSGTDPLQVPVNEACRLLGYSRATLYRRERKGEIRFNRKFGRTMVPMAEIKRLAGEDDEFSIPAPVGEPVREPDPIRPKKRQLFPEVM